MCWRDTCRDLPLFNVASRKCIVCQTPQYSSPPCLVFFFSGASRARKKRGGIGGIFQGHVSRPSVHYARCGSIIHPHLDNCRERRVVLIRCGRSRIPVRRGPARAFRLSREPIKNSDPTSLPLRRLIQDPGSMWRPSCDMRKLQHFGSASAVEQARVSFFGCKLCVPSRLNKPRRQLQPIASPIGCHSPPSDRVIHSLDRVSASLSSAEISAPGRK